MNFKKKIKRALAWALKDELIEILEMSLPTKRIEYVERTTQFQTIKLEFKVAEQLFSNPRDYEKELDSAKQQLFEEVEKFIEVESYPLVSPEEAYRRYVRLKIRVQQPKY